MYCATCGAAISAAGSCVTCGSAGVVVMRCSRCGYVGEGVGFFRRTRKVALLILFGAFTYGIGSLIYWLMRRSRRVCPNCGQSWPSSSRVGVGPPLPVDPNAIEELPSAGGFRRLTGAMALIAAAFLLVIAAQIGELPPVAAALLLATSGALLLASGIRALRERRRALLEELQRKILLLASQRGGDLTATDVAAALGLSLPAAERVLISMDDDERVRSEITAEGVLLYQFPEIRHRQRMRLSAESAE